MNRAGSLACIALLCAGVGCAHHRNDYAYAPPYAPAVYPQPPVYPQTQAAPQPVSSTALVGELPAGVVPAGAMPAGTMLPGPVVAAQASPCPQDCGAGTVMTTGVVMEGGGQTPPCPPGP